MKTGKSEGDWKTYGVYINPYPWAWGDPSLVKSVAERSGLSWLVKAESEEDAWREMLWAAERKDTWEDLIRLREGGNVLIEPWGTIEDGLETESGDD